MKFTVTTYAELAEWARAFVQRPIQILTIVGNPGLAKTTTMAHAVGDAARIISGQLSALELYRELWRHRDMPFIIDDVDDLFKDRAKVRLIKCLCQTEQVKKVSWHTTTHLLAEEEIPNEFETTTRLSVILNEYNKGNANIQAVEDRGITVWFRPSPAEVHKQVGNWFGDAEVYEFIGQYLPLISLPSMRQYVIASQIHVAGIDWRGKLLDSWGLESGVGVVARLRLEAFPTEEARAEAFTERGHGSRATYFRLKKQLRQSCGLA